jgi:hypothetical protein
MDGACWATPRSTGGGHCRHARPRGDR